MWWKKPENILGIALVLYLLFVGMTSAGLVIINFPQEQSGVLVFPIMDQTKPQFYPFGTLGSVEQATLLLAFMSGMAGSFLHAAQSLVSYLGNLDFRASWTAWYVLRPWIGGVLGLSIYFAFRAGLIAGASAVNPYGVVALGLLSGWFSKIATDKLEEVFETLFKTDQDQRRKHKLQPTERPVIDDVVPSPVPANVNDIILIGRNFQDGAILLVDGQTEVPATFESEMKLKVTFDATTRPGAGTSVTLQVKNPAGVEPLSREVQVNFQ